MEISTQAIPELEPTRAFLQRIFRVVRFQKIDFLSWLYENNPAGPAVCIDHGMPAIQGHLAMIPCDYAYQGQTLKIGLALHTAVDESARGQGLFGKMALALVEQSRAQGYSHIIGVANGNATHGWLSRAKFHLVKPLTARLGFYYGWRRADVRELAPGAVPARIPVPDDNSQDWRRTLGWRLTMPGNRYRVFDTGDAVIVIHIAYKMGTKIAVILKVLTRQKLGHARVRKILGSIARDLGTPFFLHVGFNRKFAFGGIALPRAAMPSPLNLIVKVLDPQYGVDKDFQLDSFEFLDFDAY